MQRTWNLANLKSQACVCACDCVIAAGGKSICFDFCLGPSSCPQYPFASGSGGQLSSDNFMVLCLKLCVQVTTGSVVLVMSAASATIRELTA